MLVGLWAASPLCSPGPLSGPPGCLDMGIRPAHLGSGPPGQRTTPRTAQIARERRQLGFLSSCGFFLKYAGISKSLESVLSQGPPPTGGGSSPPEHRHSRTGPQGPPSRPPRLPMATSSSQPPRERPPWSKRESPHSHPVGAPGASKAAIPSGGPVSDPELQRRVMEVRSP